ncbi:MAG: hypothetical protein J7623_13345 [Chitinophaga sp.]|uniref:hypothetical protein n=1 Tax=Chitinophaga sp. TaxID=1869181 RepID=UPI001B080141|nr:hypothetical protein [Chitinophaga sp.]MBO9729616.1 hypothetical protein [Chitinophaga sp.]
MSLEALYETIHLRKRPEDVAVLIQDVLDGQLNEEEIKVLQRAVSSALRYTVWQYTSMLEQFAKVVGAEKQVNKAIELFKLDRSVVVGGYDDPKAVAAFIDKVSPMIHKNPGFNNYETDRLNREQREAAGLDISKRRYNKLFRCLRRLEKKLNILIREHQKSFFQRTGKHAFAEDISREDFMSDINSACFIAYYTARCNLRSEFTVNGQQRPYDEIADMLLKRCQEAPQAANWWAISQVYTQPVVLEKLTGDQQGVLLGKWTSLLEQVAGFLGTLWAQNNFNSATMVVRPGNDSTTWNNTAGAWNKARDSWINLLYALGMEFVLDDVCPGKVMRLIAADVAAMHYLQGSRQDPNIAVWNRLPFPWEVFSGKAACSRSRVEAACKFEGLHPEKSGWIAPREHGVVTFRATPELVHGVTISNPYLAKVLKQHKYFSGKDVKPFSPEQN